MYSKSIQKSQSESPMSIPEPQTPFITQARRIKILAEAAIMIALASVLNLFQFIVFPQGGAVTLGGMIPILLLSLRRGPKVGVASGMVLSIVILNIPGQGFAYNPIQFLLDYPLAWGALGLAGFFKSQPLVGVGTGILGRFIFHFISGVVFIDLFAPSVAVQGIGSVVAYSALYNGSYLFPEWVISTFVMFLLLQRNILHAYL